MRVTHRRIEIAIFGIGLAAAVVAGFVGYHYAGLYGDGAFAMGFYRELDPKTGESMLVHDTRTAHGVVRRVFNNELHAVETDVDTNGDGRFDAAVAFKNDRLNKVGFSLANDGVIDAWVYRTYAGELVRIEVSTKRDGTIDRWERYENGQMVRVDLDTNGNGKPDRWQTYKDGILMDTFVDANEDGKADGPPIR